MCVYIFADVGIFVDIITCGMYVHVHTYVCMFMQNVVLQNILQKPMIATFGFGNFTSVVFL